MELSLMELIQMEVYKMELHVMELFQMELQMELENTIGWKESDYEKEDYELDLSDD